MNSMDSTASCSSSGSDSINSTCTLRVVNDHASDVPDRIFHDPVLFIAIIEFDTKEDGMCFHTKLRIRTSEVANVASNGYTACALRQRIQRHLAASASSERYNDDYDIALYDSDTVDYVPLPDEGDIVPCFGTRWRIRVTERAITTPSEITTSPLAIQTRYFHVPLTGSFEVANCALHFQQIDQAVNTSTGFQIWDGALWLTRYLEQNPSLLQRHHRVLELGAGCGVVGITAALLKAQQVILTDLPELIPLLQSNVRLNLTTLQQKSCCDVTCRPLDWTQPLPLDLPPVNLIVAADCVWMDYLVAPFLDTLRQLTDISRMNTTNVEDISNQSISYMDLKESDPSPVNSWTDIYKSRSVCRFHLSECSCHSLQEPFDTSISDFDFNMTDSLDCSMSTVVHHNTDLPFQNQKNIRSIPEYKKIRPTVIISYQRRGKSTDDKFWKGLHEIFSHVELLPLPTMKNPPADNLFYILHCER